LAFGQGSHTNAPQVAPGTIVVGVADLVALNRLRVMTGQRALKFCLILQVKSLSVIIPTISLVGQVGVKLHTVDAPMYIGLVDDTLLTVHQMVHPQLALMLVGQPGSLCFTEITEHLIVHTLIHIDPVKAYHPDNQVFCTITYQYVSKSQKRLPNHYFNYKYCLNVFCISLLALRQFNN